MTSPQTRTYWKVHEPEGGLRLVVTARERRTGQARGGDTERSSAYDRRAPATRPKAAINREERIETPQQESPS